MSIAHLSRTICRGVAARLARGIRRGRHRKRGRSAVISGAASSGAIRSWRGGPRGRVEEGITARGQGGGLAEQARAELSRAHLLLLHLFSPPSSPSPPPPSSSPDPATSARRPPRPFALHVLQDGQVSALLRPAASAIHPCARGSRHWHILALLQLTQPAYSCHLQEQP